MVFLKTVRHHNLRHAAHNIPVTRHPLFLTGNPHHAHDPAPDRNGQINALFGGFIFHLLRDIKLRQVFLYDTSCTRVKRTETGFVRAGHNIAFLIHIIDVLVDLPADLLHNGLRRGL